MPPQIKQAKLKEEFRDFANSGLWRDEKENFAFFGIDNVADWWLAKLSQAKLETLEAIIKEVEGKKGEMDNAQLSYDSSIDITELPEGLLAEMTGLKKGMNAAYNQVLTTLQKEREVINREQ